LPTNRELLAALREKLGGVSDQAISQRRQRLQRLVPAPTDIATYIVAHREGLRINKYLDPETLASVASWEAQLAQKERGADNAAIRPPNTGKRGRRTTVVREAKIGDIKVPPGGLSQKHIADAQRMAEVYPVLYVFENSVREFIDGHLTKAYGTDWWDDPKLVPRAVRDNVEKVRNAEAVNRAHTSRKAPPIYYTMLGDLVNIVISEKGARVFKRPMFPRPTWFPELVQSAEVTRNIFAHMNPLQKRDIRRLEDALSDWLDQTKDYEP
jgi:Swt1-like HEPN